MKPLIYLLLFIGLIVGLYHAFNYSIWLGVSIIILGIFGIYKYFTK